MSRHRESRTAGSGCTRTSTLGRPTAKGRFQASRSQAGGPAVDPERQFKKRIWSPERCYEGLPKPDPLNYNGDFELLSERSTEMATTQAILRGKDTTAQGELYSSFELGDKQGKITTSDAKRNASR